MIKIRLIFVFQCYEVMECKDTGEGWDGSGGYDGECHVSTWPGHGVPRYWGEYDFWVSLWSYFQMRLAFESDWVKLTALPNMDRQHPIHWGPTEQKGEGGESVVPQCVWAVSWVFSWPLTGIFCHLFPGSQVFRFGLNYILLALLDLQLAGNKSWNFSASANIMRVNSYTHTHVCVCVYNVYCAKINSAHIYWMPTAI